MYWLPKLRRNIERDRRVAKDLRRGGWCVIVVWECQTREVDRLRDRLLKLLDTAARRTVLSKGN